MLRQIEVEVGRKDRKRNYFRNLFFSAEIDDSISVAELFKQIEQQAREICLREGFRGEFVDFTVNPIASQGEEKPKQDKTIKPRMHDFFRQVHPDSITDALDWAVYIMKSFGYIPTRRTTNVVEWKSEERDENGMIQTREISFNADAKGNIIVHTREFRTYSVFADIYEDWSCRIDMDPARFQPPRL